MMTATEKLGLFDACLTAYILKEREMPKIDFTVPCDDGDDRYMFAADAEGAYWEAIERGYNPISVEDIYETPD